MKFISIDKILPEVPKAVRSASNQNELLMYMLEAYRSLEAPTTLDNKGCILHVKNHSTKLPPGCRVVNYVSYYSQTDPDAKLDGKFELADIPCETEEIVGKYILAHKLYITTEHYQKNYKPLKKIQAPKYSESDAKYCHDCNNTFSVDKTNTLWTDLEDCYIFVDFDCEAQDEEGNYLIIDDFDIKRYLNYYAQYQHWLNRSYMKEEGASRIAESLLYQSDIYRNKARGIIMQLSLNRQLIEEITVNGKNQRFLKLGDSAYRE